VSRRRHRLSLSLYLALRYLRSARRDAFVTFLSATAAGGMALGVAALVLALAMLSGLQGALRSEILARTPEIEAVLPTWADPTLARDRASALDGVLDARLAVLGRGWLMVRGRVRPVELTGFEGRLPATFPGATAEANGLYVSERLATAWALEPGDLVEVASSRPTLTPLGPLPRVRRLRLAGTYVSGRTEQEERAALPLAEARALLGDAGLRLRVSTGDLGRSARLAPVLESVLPQGAAVRTWRELNRGLFFALRLEKSLLFSAVLLIVVVAGLALVADLSLIIASKRPELGMLGAMGATPRALRRVFLWLGGLLVALGGGAGLAIGIGGSWLLDRSRLLRLGEAFFIDYVPFRVQIADLTVVSAVVAALTFLCAGYAARRAAALSPIEALRR
jgi:lipoprotein-releasing system permease protein